MVDSYYYITYYKDLIQVNTGRVVELLYLTQVPLGLAGKLSGA